MPHTIKIKYDSIDVLKFILSFLIIQIHTEFYFIWMKPYVRLAVPIFFIISAFFFFRRNPGKEQLIGYIKRLSILYLFWFIVWGLYFVYANRAIVFSSQGFVFILRSLVFGSTFAASWYIAASIIGTIIVYVLSKLLNDRWLIFITALIYITINLLAELNYKRFMFKKLCILLIFSKLNEIKHLIDKYRMHNLYAIFAKLLNICKQIAGNLVNESGNVPRRGVVPKFSDLEVVALNMASEAVGIDSESLLFANLQEYRVEIPNLISRRQYNDRRKITSSLCNAIRERMVAKMDGGEDYFCIDSKPIEVCRIARSKRCSMGKKDFSKAPGVGYCASQSMYYYGYKLHAVCGLSGVIHSFDLTKASVHDIHYLKDVKVDYSNCTVIGDRGYISAQVQLDLFETANIRLEVPYRCNQKEWKPTFPAFAKARKRIETLFSQLCDQFMIIRNYAKDTDGLFARIIGKISALTILQYINYKNEKPIGRVKYALF